MEITYWNKNIETMDRPAIEALQLQRLRELVDQSLKMDFYKNRLLRVGITSSEDIQSLDDLRRLPFNVKDDLRQNFPTGLLAVDMRDVVRVHSSSGTTGIPTVIYFSRQDMDNWTDLLARSIVATGCCQDDVFQNMMTYGLFTGGLGLHYGAERVGMTVIPVGGGNTQRQVQIMKDFKTTVLHVTPSYLLHIHSKLESFETRPEDLYIQRVFLGAEPYSENTRLKLEDLYGIDAYNSYGLSEMNGPGVAFECVYKQGMHVWEDAYILEIIDPETGEILPDGEQGEVVLTNLVRSAMPLFRYRTRDLAYVNSEPCRCGRTHRRLSRIQGRTDDMLIINGVNVFPSQIEEVIMAIPEVGTNYLIHLTKIGSLDKLAVKVEIYSKLFTGDMSALDGLKAKIKEKLRASITINPVIELHEPGALPHSEGKAKRVLDEREQL
ncbi:MAG: phenylacetate--CoA ligase [Planctomycetota bacterium]|nr:MAG: phenylacetate--CoA ligase [Planctomycetota bacterium]RKY13939.1 MAG: phenylacetate--CoA ligase [Planctomycetota bacterium]